MTRRQPARDPDPAADRHWMEQALALGARADGSTSPNPRVGCVLVRDGRAIGCGVHRAPGLPHAEAAATEVAGDAARGSTAYVNLEPCVHQGRTPPCVDALIEAGVARVVAAIQDPNPLVDGKGFEALKRAGVDVNVGVHAAAATRLNRAFVHFHRTGRPLVTLKAAMTTDGLIAAREGRSQWITGGDARRFAHRLRLRHDAVLVGAGTVRRDDPLLTVRLPGVEASRARVVLAPALDLDPGSRLFGPCEPPDSPVVVYGSDGADAARAARLSDRAEVVTLPIRNGRLDLRAVLADLARRGIQALLVEGGGRTIASFLDAGVADRAVLFVAGSLIGSRGATALIEGATAPHPSRGWRLGELRQLAVGDDQCWTADLVGPPREVA